MKQEVRQSGKRMEEGVTEKVDIKQNNAGQIIGKKIDKRNKKLIKKC